MPPASPEQVSANLTLKDAQVIFQVIGQISADEDNATLDGIHDGPNAEESRLAASCWIEARPDFISCIQWNRIPTAVAAVAAAVPGPGPVEVSSMLRADPETGKVKLKVHWNQAANPAIPMFDCAGNLVQVETAELHGRPLRVLFWIHCGEYNSRRVLLAELIYLVDI
ncbi:hypothetical protein SCP_0303620 [Sparassis crispa]|uniref:Uncharacterized protein n=1 Tax=Sparassis crispa TaxID=139825 RepID=A0A401GEU0_9APHY|nr:hypothetical protein SCP_0303620 [Sparassis crispa]GBE80645.1 hypothetical protein SCP_0303620 [Sparassis crispa]